MAFDYSQAELRMMAHLSGDETYLEAFAKGVDPHLAINDLVAVVVYYGLAMIVLIDMFHLG